MSEGDLDNPDDADLSDGERGRRRHLKLQVRRELTDESYSALVNMARGLYGANLGGTPRQNEARKWMTDVEPGDLVVEVTSRGDYRTTRGKELGRLVEIRDEPVLDEDGKQYATERFWFVETPFERVRWHNARFVRVPSSKHEWELLEWGHDGPTGTGYIHVFNCKDCQRARASSRKP